jgi:hypothetical protein
MQNDVHPAQMMDTYLQYVSQLSGMSAQQQMDSLESVYQTFDIPVDIMEVHHNLAENPAAGSPAYIFQESLKSAFHKTLQKKVCKYKKMAGEDAGKVFDTITNLFALQQSARAASLPDFAYSDVKDAAPELENLLKSLDGFYALLLPYVNIPALIDLNEDAADAHRPPQQAASQAASQEPPASVWYTDDLALLWAMGKYGITPYINRKVGSEVVPLALVVNEVIPYWLSRESTHTRAKPAEKVKKFTLLNGKSTTKTINWLRTTGWSAMLSMVLPNEKVVKANAIPVRDMEEYVRNHLRKHPELQLLTGSQEHALKYLNSYMATGILKADIMPKVQVTSMFVVKQLVDLRAAIGDLVSSLRTCSGAEMKGSVSRYFINTTCAMIVNTFANSPQVYEKAHLNMLLMGPPGAGKTRYANIIGRVLKGLGLLISQKPYKELSRSDLVGEFLGQTGPRTKKALVESLENVLFIDEAYMLAQKEPSSLGKPPKWDQYGYEAIGEIVNFLDKHKGEICVIAAGYVREMTEGFLKVNEGMPRRFPYQILLAPYVPEELVAIFCFFLNKLELGFKEGERPSPLTPEAETYLRLLIEHTQTRLFPNSAGDMENLATMSAESLMYLRSRAPEHALHQLTLAEMVALVEKYCMYARGEMCTFGTTAGIFSGVKRKFSALTAVAGGGRTTRQSALPSYFGQTGGYYATGLVD